LKRYRRNAEYASDSRAFRPIDRNGRLKVVIAAEALERRKSLQIFLRAAPQGTPILITGHSLGGCLASVLAPCVAHWVGNASTCPLAARKT
jgi:hypothetical protein